MFRSLRTVLAVVAVGTGLSLAGCANTGADVPAAGSQVSIEGAVASIDTQPWTYDGNAVIEVDTDARGRVPVQLPARWNLCRAEAVDVDALSVGMRVQAVGTAGGEGELVVCQEPSHRLVPVK